jgi:hypothetical protein
MNLLGWGDLYTKTLCKLYKLGGQPARNGQFFKKTMKKNSGQLQGEVVRCSLVDGNLYVIGSLHTNSLWVSPSRNW